MVFSLTEIEIIAQNSHSRFVHDCRNRELTERRRFFPSPDFFQFHMVNSTVFPVKDPGNERIVWSTSADDQRKSTA